MMRVVLVLIDPSWLNVTNDTYHAEVVHDIQFVDARLFSSLQFNRLGSVRHHHDYDLTHLR